MSNTLDPTLHLVRQDAYRLPAAFTPPPEEPLLEFEPKVIVHRILSFRPDKIFLSLASKEAESIESADSTPYIFTASGQTYSLQDTTLREFIQERVANPSSANTDPVPETTGSPYDIEVDEQCHVVLELAHGEGGVENWRFMIGSRGVTTRKFHGSDNFGVTFVDKMGDFYEPDLHEIVPLADCKILIFNVARRRRPSRQKFNFYIEFFASSGSSAPGTILPTIFDPGVPNTGGASFP